MGRSYVCALLVCLLPAAAGASSEHSPVAAEPFPGIAELFPAAPELSSEQTTFAYRVRHAARPLPDIAFDALWFGGDALAPPRIAVAEPIVEAPAMTVGHVPSRAALCGHAAALAARHDLPASFFANLIQQESGFRSHAVSPVGAQGIAQFMPRTARAYGLENPFDPLHSMAVSAKFLRELLGQFGNLGLAAAAYNAGPKRVQDWINRRGKLPEETRNYVQNITGQPAERWARVKAPTEGKTLPAHARCPGIPVMEVSVPEAAPVKVAKGKAKAKGKATQIAAKADKAKDKKADVPAPATSRKAAALIKDGKIQIVAKGKSAKAKAAAKPAKGGKKVAAKPAAVAKQAKSQGKSAADKRVKVAAAR